MYPIISSPAPVYSLHHEDNDVSEKNFFDSLPDAIILSIFNKLHDYKTLILCSLVSKHFYFLTSQIDSVQLHINYLEDKHTQPKKSFHILNFFKNIITPTKWNTKIKNSSVSPIPKFSLVPSHVLAQLNHKFPQIKSLQVTLHSCFNNFEKDSNSNSSNNNNTLPFIKWKAIFGSCLESCVILSASSFCKKNNDTTTTTSKCNRSAPKGGLSEIDLKWIKEATKCCILNASFRLTYYVPHSNNIKNNESLESVVVLDDCGRGKLCMGRGQIEEFNNIHVENDGFGFDSPEKMRKQRLKSVEGPFHAKVWYIPMLDLPFCGSVMKKVTLVVVKRLGSEIVMESDVESLKGAFGKDEDGKVCDEALMEIVKFDEKKSYHVKIPCSLD